MKILRHVVVITIFAKLLSNQFFTRQNKILKLPIGLGIVSWFSQVFGLILMLLKNLSNLFKAFGQSGEMDFFPSQVHQFVFILFYIILSIYKKSELLKQQYSWIVQLALFHQPLFFFFKCVKLQ